MGLKYETWLLLFVLHACKALVEAARLLIHLGYEESLEMLMRMHMLRMCSPKKVLVRQC